MARPTKAIVDYFPHIASQGKTLFILEQNYGDKGYCFWFKLLEMLATTENHFIDVRNEETFEFLMSKTRTEESLCLEILNKLSKLDAIDKELWQHKIIFSENFIKNIQDAYRNRKVKILNKNDLLQQLCPDEGVSDVRNYAPTIIYDVINPQTKLNKIKVNKYIYTCKNKKFEKLTDQEIDEEKDIVLEEKHYEDLKTYYTALVKNEDFLNKVMEKYYPKQIGLFRSSIDHCREITNFMRNENSGRFDPQKQVKSYQKPEQKTNVSLTPIELEIKQIMEEKSQQARLRLSDGKHSE